MIAVVLAAILGSTSGLFVKSPALALALSLTFSGVAQYSMILLCCLLARDESNQALVDAIQGVVGDRLIALLPTLAAAGCATVVAAIMLAMSRREKEGEFWLPGLSPAKDVRDRRRHLRPAAQVEERPIHARAESRIDKIMRM
ncbi:MAG: hypothetical protein P4L64_00435 [Caulobacteraceae bacterium]|nr:hypothetical protein [Caulobacteraceae bacterium]